ncbi:MAG TPA: hydantoinase/oxoprolinase family protein [Acidimicrobiales bacterium]|jgi:N-methylhydantoinase A|nr:hydantoinase/oxoprolinase family protein [Acidimicrobiales bacterium]
MSDAIRLGVDIGGTFTDAVIIDGERSVRAKSLTTVDDLRLGVLDACSLAATRLGTSLDQLLPSVKRFGLGTTEVTNKIATRNWLRVGLVTTLGFEDAVPEARGRFVSEGGWLVPPPQLVDRNCIVGVRERIDRNGTVLQAIDECEVLDKIEHLVADQRIEAVAVSFLWSFLNPTHEVLAVQIIRREFPHLPVTSGAQLHPVMREYERTTFALLNAATADGLNGIDVLASELSERGLRVPILLVHSGGGSLSIDEARRTPVLLAESGPAAGVAAAASVALAAGHPDAITCDMGGTTFDLSVVRGGAPTRRSRGDVMGIWTAMTMVDVDSIGAGGGSIAWADAIGGLCVGPRSAGSNPGPACYGKGGSEPTVTDALLVLGFMDSERFLDGSMTLDREASLGVCGQLGESIGLDPIETAWGIREIALAGMVNATRGRLAERGLDPRRHALVGFGGCAGLFTVSIASALGIATVISPAFASVLSALGAATLEVRRERSHFMGIPVTGDITQVRLASEKLAMAVDEDLSNDGVPEADRTITFEWDLRVSLQKSELSVPIRTSLTDPLAVSYALDDFHQEYSSRYGVGSLSSTADVELAVIRAVGTGHTSTLYGDKHESRIDEANSPGRKVARRSLQVDRIGERQEVSVILSDDLQAGDAIKGPVLVDDHDTTVWMPPGATGVMDRNRSILIEVGPG